MYSQPGLRTSVFYKGPILAITEHNTKITCLSSLFSVSIYKKSAKRVLLDLQSAGNTEEWPPFLLHNIPGLRQSSRAGRLQISYETSQAEIELDI